MVTYGILILGIQEEGVQMRKKPIKERTDVDVKKEDNLEVMGCEVI